jgi:hypothetical protein
MHLNSLASPQRMVEMPRLPAATAKRASKLTCHGLAMFAEATGGGFLFDSRLRLYLPLLLANKVL